MSTPEHLGERIDAAEKNLQRLIDWTGRCDNKASIIIGVALAMGGVIVTVVPPIGQWPIALFGFALLSFLLVVSCLVFAYLTIWPRVKPPNDSLVFFGTMAKHSLNQYIQSFRNQSQSEYFEDLLAQCHVNAQIVSVKFVRLKWAYGFLLGGTIPWVLTIYIIKTLPNTN